MSNIAITLTGTGEECHRDPALSRSRTVRIGGGQSGGASHVFGHSFDTIILCQRHCIVIFSD
jgi:hypothetical protein